MLCGIDNLAPSLSSSDRSGGTTYSPSSSSCNYVSQRVMHYFANNFMICNHMQLYVKAVEADLNMLNMPSLRNQLLPMYRMRTETLLHYEHRFFREYF